MNAMVFTWHLKEYHCIIRVNIQKLGTTWYGLPCKYGTSNIAMVLALAKALFYHGTCPKTMVLP